MITETESRFIFDTIHRVGRLGGFTPSLESPERSGTLEPPASLQEHADAILARMILTVCDGWTEPKHARIILEDGDPAQPISHGMCATCSAAMQAQEVA